MQIDLAQEGIQFYAFTVDHGQLIAFGTRSALGIPDPRTNFLESPLLAPLTQFDFNIYTSPGL